jgi:hypothetical protein
MNEAFRPPQDIALEVEPEFEPYLAAAIARFQYLHADVGVLRERSTVIRLRGGDPSSVVRDFRYTLYREKIHAESLQMREVLMGALLR